MSQIVRVAIVVGVTTLVALAPVGASTASTGRLTSAQCEDCQPHQYICCGDCTVIIQEKKCTIGESWCH